MNKIAKFYKVSFEQFMEDFINIFGFNYQSSQNVEALRETYDRLILPRRSTANSAGYDFVSTIDFELEPNETITIPTGIRCQFNSDWVLNIYPRSGIGFNYRVGLANSTGIIDSDYINSRNEGHIMVKLENRGEKVFTAKEGDKIVQGVFLQYGITIDDDADGERIGGFGSTDKN